MRNIILIVCIMLLACGAAVETRRYLRHWRDTVSLHEYMLALEPNLAPLHNDYGLALLESSIQRNNAIHAFRRAVEIDPRSLKYRVNLGRSLAQVGQPRAALRHLHEALRQNRNYLPALYRLTWLLATHPDPNVQNADESLRLAKRAAYLTGHRSARVLDTLAVAWAANDRFDEAVATAKKALWVTSKTNQKELAGDITKRLELYEQGKPYREDPTWPEMKSQADVSQEQLEAKNENLKETVL